MRDEDTKSITTKLVYLVLLTSDILLYIIMLQECGAVAASLSLTSLFPHSGVIESVASSGPVCPGTDSPASHNNNLATIIEDENKVGNSNIVGNKENEGYFDDNYGESIDLSVAYTIIHYIITSFTYILYSLL